jgi:hypothetical protein
MAPSKHVEFLTPRCVVLVSTNKLADKFAARVRANAAVSALTVIN